MYTRQNKMISCLLVVALLSSVFSTTATAFGFDSLDADALFDDEFIVKVDETEITTVSSGELGENEPVSVQVIECVQGVASVLLSVSDELVTNYASVTVVVTQANSKMPICNELLSLGKSKLQFDGVLVDTAYSLFITMENGDDVCNLFGEFVVKNKDNDLWTECNLTCESYKTMAYINEVVHQLENLIARTESVQSVDGQEEQSEYLSEISDAITQAIDRYESESNNTMSTADILNDDDTMYGTIGYEGDVDYFKVKFACSGNANFWLGDIPAGEDYDLYLYSSSGALIAGSESSTSQEQIYNFQVAGEYGTIYVSKGMAVHIALNITVCVLKIIHSSMQKISMSIIIQLTRPQA